MKFEILSKQSAIKHIVTQKELGYGCGFSLALHTGEDQETILSNRATIEEYFGKEKIYCSLKQVHSSKVYIFDEDKSVGWSTLEDAKEADAVITNKRGVVLSILTADCVPILLYDPIRQAIGAVHAGWRGSANGILNKTISMMQHRFGSDAKDILVAIAPSIGGCCYEVGEDVASHFGNCDKSVLREGDKDGKYFLDLKRFNELQALKAGVMPENIEVSSICTSCENRHFFSYRAEDGCSGRFMSAITLE